MSEEEKPCEEPEVYGPTRPPKRPAAIGRRFNGGVKQFRPNGAPMTRKVSKAERRIRRRASMIVATRPIDGQLAGAAVQRAEVERNTSNSHEASRLLNKERQFQRAARGGAPSGSPDEDAGSGGDYGCAVELDRFAFAGIVTLEDLGELKRRVSALAWPFPPSVDVVLRGDCVELDVRSGTRRFRRAFVIKR